MSVYIAYFLTQTVYFLPIIMVYLCMRMNMKVKQEIGVRIVDARYLMAGIMLCSLMITQSHAAVTKADIAKKAQTAYTRVSENTAEGVERLSKSAFIKRANSMFATLKNDMRCMYKWNFTPEQKRRIRNTAIGIVVLIGTVYFGPNIKRWFKPKLLRIN